MNKLQASSNKMKWLKSPLFYIPVIGLLLYFTLFMPYNNRLVQKEDKRIYITTTQNVTGQIEKENIVSIPANTRLYALCYYLSTIVVDDDKGNRVSIPEDAVEGEVENLKFINRQYEFYVKANTPESIGQGVHIKDVTDKIGDYLFGNVATGEYFFPQIVAVDGKMRHYELTLFTDENGIVQRSECGKRTSWNLFGMLPFYSDIVSWNLFTGRTTYFLLDQYEIPEKGSGGILSWIWGVIWGLIKFVLKLFLFLLFVTVLFALPLFIIFPLAKMMTFVKGISNGFIGSVLSIAAFVVEYIWVISFVEATKSIWIVSLPIAVFIAMVVASGFIAGTLGGRCPKCRRNDATQRKEEKLGVVEEYYEKKDHFKEGSKKWYGKYNKNGERILIKENTYWTTSCLVTVTEYHITETCRFCDYRNEFNQKRNSRGDVEEINRWTEEKKYREVEV